MSDSDSRERYSFGSFQLDADQKVLSRDGEIVPLAPKAADVLIALARRKGEIASKDELFAAGWPDTWVDDSTLAKVIYTLRRDLGPMPDGRPLIENIPKRGYRLALEVAATDTGPPGASPMPAALRRPALRAFAIVTLVLLGVVAGLVIRSRTENPAERVDLLVMPFTSGASTEEQSIASGIGDFLATRLATVPGLSIISPALAASEGSLDSLAIARRLGADVVLTGVVSRTGNRVRVTYNLVSVEDRRLVGADSLEATSPDIFEIEDRVASWITTSLKLQQSLRKVSDKALATSARQQTYIRALGCLRPNTPQPRVDQALALLQSLDPEGQSSPWVLTAIGRAYLDAFSLSHDPRDLELAESHVERAARLDPEHPRVRALLGAIHSERGQFERAVTELQAALAREPDATDVLLDLASIYNTMGRQNDAESTLKYLLDVHPRCAVCLNRMGRFHSQNGRLEKAIEMYGGAIELAPDAAAFHASLAGVLIKAGRFAEAVPVLETAISISPSAISSSNLGYCFYLLGDYDSASRHFGDAVSLAPNTFLYRGNLGDSLRLIPSRRSEADKTFDKAIELARASLEINPNDALTHALLAEYLAKRGAIDAASVEISDALTNAAPDAADIYLSAAIVRMISGEKSSAIAFLQRAVDAGLDPSIIERDPQFEPLRSEPDFSRFERHP